MSSLPLLNTSAAQVRADAGAQLEPGAKPCLVMAGGGRGRDTNNLGRTGRQDPQSERSFKLDSVFVTYISPTEYL